MRAFVVGLLLLLAALDAIAAEGRKYAVLSLIGDRLLLVTREMATGSRLDRNERSYVDLPDPALDNATSLAIDDALRKSGAGTGAVLLAVRDPRLFALQKDMVEGGGETAALIAALRERLGQVQATHLVLATKYRHRSMLRFVDGHVGSGSLEGLGFYIDHVLMTEMRETGERGAGFLAPFAYFRLSLIDLADWKVVREEQVLGSRAISAGRAKSGHPWEAMSADAKANALRAIIRREVAEVVPKLVAD